MNEKKALGVTAMTTVTLSKWGNSSAIRIPAQYLKALNLEDGAELQIMMTDDHQLLIKPFVKAEETNEDLRAHLQMLLGRIKPGTERHEEVDYGVEGDELI